MKQLERISLCTTALNQKTWCMLCCKFQGSALGHFESVNEKVFYNGRLVPILSHWKSLQEWKIHGNPQFWIVLPENVALWSQGQGQLLCPKISNLFTNDPVWDTVMCLSIGTPNNNQFSICSKWKIYYFSVSQYLGTLQPKYDVLKY